MDPNTEIVYALVTDAIQQYDSKCLFAEDTAECFIEKKNAGKKKEYVPIPRALSQDEFSVDVKNKSYVPHHYEELDFLGQGNKAANAKLIDAVSRALVPSSSVSSTTTSLLPFGRTRDLILFIRNDICQRLLPAANPPARVSPTVSPVGYAIIGIRLFFSACRFGRDSRCLRYREAVRLERLVERWLWEKAPGAIRECLFPPFHDASANNGDDNDDRAASASARTKKHGSFSATASVHPNITEGLLTAVDFFMQERFRIFRFNPSDGQAPMYSVRIKKPMSFSAVANLVRAGAITTKRQLEESVSLIVSNCRLYNGTKSEFTAVAQAMLEESVLEAAMKHLPRVEGNTRVADGPKLEDRWLSWPLEPGVFLDQERENHTGQDGASRREGKKKARTGESAAAAAAAVSSAWKKKKAVAAVRGKKKAVPVRQDDDDDDNDDDSDSSTDSILSSSTDSCSSNSNGSDSSSDSSSSSSDDDDDDDDDSDVVFVESKRGRGRGRGRGRAGGGRGRGRGRLPSSTETKQKKKQSGRRRERSDDEEDNNSDDDDDAAHAENAMGSDEKEKKSLSKEELQDVHDTFVSIWTVVKEQREPKVERLLQQHPAAVSDEGGLPAEVAEELAALMGLHEMVEEQMAILK